MVKQKTLFIRKDDKYDLQFQRFYLVQIDDINAYYAQIHMIIT